MQQRKESMVGLRSVLRLKNSSVRNPLVCSLCTGTLFALSGIVVFAAMANAAVLEVRVDGTGEYDSVFEAIMDAEDGDTVRVFPGYYDESDSNGVPRIAYKLDTDFSLVGDGYDFVTIAELLVAVVRGSFRCEGVEFTGSTTAIGTGDGSIDLFECRFRDISTDLIGAIEARPGTLMIEDCIFENCSAAEGGGAIFADEVTVVGSTFIGCSADQGAAILGGSVFLEDCLVWGCSAERGIIEAFEVEISHSTIWGNQAGIATILSDPGGAPSSVTMQSSILGNTEGGYGIQTNSYVTLDCVAIYETLPNSAPEVFAENVTTENPLFCDEDEGDFGLQPGSPCAPGGVPGCGLIGREGIGCGATPIRYQTWGSLKLKFLVP